MIVECESSPWVNHHPYFLEPYKTNPWWHMIVDCIFNVFVGGWKFTPGESSPRVNVHPYFLEPYQMNPRLPMIVYDCWLYFHFFRWGWKFTPGECSPLFFRTIQNESTIAYDCLGLLTVISICSLGGESSLQVKVHPGWMCHPYFLEPYKMNPRLPMIVYDCWLYFQYFRWGVKVHPGWKFTPGECSPLFCKTIQNCLWLSMIVNCICNIFVGGWKFTLGESSPQVNVHPYCFRTIQNESTIAYDCLWLLTVFPICSLGGESSPRVKVNPGWMFTLIFRTIPNESTIAYDCLGLLTVISIFSLEGESMVKVHPRWKFTPGKCSPLFYNHTKWIHDCLWLSMIVDCIFNLFVGGESSPRVKVHPGWMFTLIF